MRTLTFKQLRPVIFAGIGCFVAALMLSSCSKTPQERILGKWSVEGKPSVVEFFKDGTVITTDNGTATPAKYTFLNNSNVEMQMSAPVGTNKIFVRMDFTVAIQKDTADFSITAPPHPGEPAKTQTMHLVRIK